MMEAGTVRGIGRNEEKWRFTANALDILYCYVQNRREEVERTFETLDTEDPYLLGYGDGFRSGFSAVVAMIGVASMKASSGQYMLDTKDSRRLAFGEDIQA